MKDELNSKLVEILSSIQSAAGKASDFAVEQLPDIAQSYIMYGRVYGTTMLLFFVLVLVLCAYGTVLSFRKLATDNGDDYGPAFVMCSLGAILSGLIVLFSAKNVFLVWLAPKVWFIKEIAGLLK